MSRRILLVEDDLNLTAVLSDTLMGEGFQVESLSDGGALASRLSQQRFDLLLLDVMLPGEDGFSLCRRLRTDGFHIPLILLTALDTTMSKVQGLSAGADDYVSKPFDPAELVARIRALLRRSNLNGAMELAEFRFDGVYVDFFKGVAMHRGERVSLSGKELQLLRYLISRRGMVVSRDELLREVWGYAEAITRTVDVHIAALRQKLEDDPKHPAHILTIRGEGYLFRE